MASQNAITHSISHRANFTIFLKGIKLHTFISNEDEVSAKTNSYKLIPTNFLLLLMAFTTSGCIPLKKEVQNSFHVNSVLVQDKDANNAGYDCSSRKNDDEMPCVINLDNYKFSDETSNPALTALARLSNCEKAAAATSNSVTAIKKISSAQTLLEIKSNERISIEKEIYALNKNLNEQTKLFNKLNKKQNKSKIKESLKVDIEKINQALATTNKQLADKQIALRTAQNAENQTHELVLTSKADLQSASYPQKPMADDPESCRVMRNALEDEILYRSQQICKKHLSDVLATSSIVNTNLGMAGIIFSTIGAVVGGVQAKSTMSALSGASSATQNLVNKEIYRDYIVPAILKAISSDRDRKLVDIRSDQSKDVINYSVSRSIYDAVDYHERCSFAHGLELLATDAEKRTPPRQEELEAQFTKNNAMVTTMRDSLDKSSSIEKAIIEKTMERLLIENDTIVTRINLMKRTQSSN